MSTKRALGWVIFWIVAASIFSVGVFRFMGREAGLEFVTCYAIEWSLSVDNLFVFLMIFEAYGVSEHRQLRALNWGIIGAMIMRLVFIYLGVTLVNLFEPVLYIFGALLIYSGYKMAVKREGENKVSESRIVKWVQGHFRMTDDFVDEKFFVKVNSKWFATPMLLVLITIESSDIMFAIDSIPAALAITRSPFIIYSANIFAILGLRALYFVLAHAQKAFAYLKIGVSIILVYVGIKMIVVHFIHINPLYSLIFVAVCLGGSILASVMFKGSTENSSD
ncbi:TerC/Alx family metal homeostasis membrane protein [Calditrichota bacterium]